jgi:hypothetical protein
VARQHHDQWLSLWDGYNAFYGSGAPALASEITQTARFFDASEPVHALVAEQWAVDRASADLRWAVAAFAGVGD